MRVLPGDVVSYTDNKGSTQFLKVNSIVNNQIVGKQFLVHGQDDWDENGPVVVITKDDVLAIR